MSKLVSENPKPPTISTERLQKVLLNKPANHYAQPRE